MSKAPLTIRENQWFSLRDVPGYPSDAPRRYLWQEEINVRSQQIKHDLRLRRTPLSLEEREGDPYIRATGIAGTLRVFNTDFQIMPKFVDTAAGWGAWQESVLTMLARARRSGYTYSHLRRVTRQQVPFLDHVALAYRDALEQALRAEPIHVYQIREETAPFLRGRLAVGRQMRALLDHPHRIQCDVDYLETDNAFNRLLHWAGERFLVLVYDGQVRRQLSDALSRLPAVSPPPRLPARLPISVPPQYRHYAEAVEIASALARGYGHGQTTGRWSGYGYVLNMERLFEAFVEKSLMQAVRRLEGEEAYIIKPQETRLYAQAIEHSGKSYFTRPDNVLYQGDKAVLVVDAKYKRLADAEEGTTLKPRNTDIYQLFASLSSHACGRGLLVYPRILADEELGEDRVRFWHVPAGGHSLLLAAVALDVSNLSSSAALQQFDEKLAEVIRRVLRFEPAMLSLVGN